MRPMVFVGPMGVDWEMVMERLAMFFA